MWAQFHVIACTSFTGFASAKIVFMPRIHTHYDNLKVTRNAPPEVIRAAYKTLCQKFHPDRNPDNENAKKTFLLIRTAYETLSDPEKRRLHDAWIVSVEATENLDTAVLQPTAKPEKATASTARARAQSRTPGKKGRFFQFGFWLVILLLILIGFFFD
jgi:DnaJ-class molecular chaperone